MMIFMSVTTSFIFLAIGVLAGWTANEVKHDQLYAKEIEEQNAMHPEMYDQNGYVLNDIQDLKIQSSSFSKSMQLQNVYVVQQYNQIPIHNALGNFAIKNGKIVSFKGSYVNDVAAKVNSTIASLTPQEAVIRTAQVLNLSGVNDVRLIREKSSTNRSMRASDSIRSTCLFSSVPLSFPWFANAKRGSSGIELQRK